MTLEGYYKWSATKLFHTILITHSDSSRESMVYTIACLSVCLNVCFFPHDTSKSDAARITKLDVEMFRHESWKRTYFGVKKSKEVKVTRRKKNGPAWVLHSCECWRFLVTVLFRHKRTVKNHYVAPLLHSAKLYVTCTGRAMLSIRRSSGCTRCRYSLASACWTTATSAGSTSTTMSGTSSCSRSIAITDLYSSF